MRTLYTILLLLLLWPCTQAADPLAGAAQAYDKELYNDALKLYLDAERTVGTSSSLCYNIGNTYYKLKDNARAILYYERALLLDPANGDARFNLEFVREKAQISEDSGGSYFTDWIAGMVSRLSSNTWATVALVSLLLLLLAVAAYLFFDSVVLRKIGFFGGMVLLVLTVLANVAAYYVHGKAIHHDTAIVVVEQATLSTAPRVPKDKSEEAMLLGSGHKVQIVDSVVNGGTKWLDVRTADGHRAWITSKDVEVI